MKRRHFEWADKVAAVRRHLLENTPVSEICDELAIAPTMFYQWQKQVFENALANPPRSGRKNKSGQDAKDRMISKLHGKLDQKNEVIAELMAEHVQLKKDLGEL